MKKLFCLLFVMTICMLASPSTFAQTTGVTERKFDELVNEVRQLRLEVQRLSASAQRMQLLLDRSRSQQELVTRLTQQLGDTRDQINQARLDQSRLTAMIEHFEKQKAAGLKSDEELKSLSAEKEDRKQREQILLQRELQLSSELEAERATLNDLKTRLDNLEQEIATPNSEPTKRDE
jgi:chromosome segregation ATPase